MNQPRPTLAPLSLDGEAVIACDCELFLGPNGPLPMQGVTHLKLEEITAQILSAIGPTQVILPLFTAQHDAAMAIELLEELGYRGRITVLAPALPKPRLVERELRALGPGLRLTLVTPGAAG